MTAPDELERAVERLTVATQKRDAGCQQDARHTWGSQRGDKGKYLEAERSAATVAGVRLNDLRLLLSERAELLATVEMMREENQVLRATPWPREYVLERASEWARLLREVNGYIKTCRGSCGSDMAGRDYAIDASDKLIAMLSEARAALTTGEEK